MWKCLFYVFILASVSCRFSGDSCIGYGRVATCTELSKCEPLQREIYEAGSPMPYHMALKLQDLTCGFNSLGPLVCCIDSSIINWDETTDIELPNRKQEDENNSFPIWVGTDNQKGSNNEDRDNRIIIKPDDGPPDVSQHPNLNKLPSDCGSSDSFRISGGNRTALYDMPWMVLLAYNTTRENKFNCGGALINEWYVLTAAHCVAFLGERMQLDYAILGEWDTDTDPDCQTTESANPNIMVQTCAPRKRDVGIAKLIPHAGYRPQTLVDDIALIRLAEPADFSLDTMAPICLPVTRTLQTEDLVGQTGIVAGWGVTERGLQSSVLLSVGLDFITNKDCEAAYRGSPRVHDKQICAGGEGDKDSCVGDSGGPIIFPGKITSGGIKYVQRGIVSYGTARCGGSIPAVYTNVAYYMDWILNNIS